jgi:hypothetical protein
MAIFQTIAVLKKVGSLVRLTVAWQTHQLWCDQNRWYIPLGLANAAEAGHFWMR